MSKRKHSRNGVHNLCRNAVKTRIDHQVGNRRRQRDERDVNMEVNCPDMEAAMLSAPVKEVVPTMTVMTDKRYYENVAFTSKGFSAQKVRDGMERAIRVIVKARRGFLKKVVADYEIVVPTRR